MFNYTEAELKKLDKQTLISLVLEVIEQNKILAESKRAASDFSNAVQVTKDLQHNLYYVKINTRKEEGGCYLPDGVKEKVKNAIKFIANGKFSGVDGNTRYGVRVKKYPEGVYYFDTLDDLDKFVRYEDDNNYGYKMTVVEKQEAKAKKK